MTDALLVLGTLLGSILGACLLAGPPPNRYSWRHKTAPWCAAVVTPSRTDRQPHPDVLSPTAQKGTPSHRHFLGWSERHGVEAFEHEHERGDEPHEHVLRDGGTEVKRTTWGPTRAADVPGQR